MTKKLIKLINNERRTTILKSAKACDSTSRDYCSQIDRDGAGCTLYALDTCTKDYNSCNQGADDTCSYDYDACNGVGAEDL